GDTRPSPNEHPPDRTLSPSGFLRRTLLRPAPFFRPQHAVLALKAGEDISLAADRLDDPGVAGIGLKLATQFHDDSVKAAIEGMPMPVENAAAEIDARQ